MVVRKMPCPECRKWVREGSVTCHWCGFDFPKPQVTTEAHSVGAWTSDGVWQTTCKRCGKILHTSGPASYTCAECSPASTSGLRFSSQEAVGDKLMRWGEGMEKFGHDWTRNVTMPLLLIIGIIILGAVCVSAAK